MKPEKNHLVGGFNPLKNSQLGLLFPTEWKKNHVPNHQAVMVSVFLRLQRCRISNLPLFPVGIAGPFFCHQLRIECGRLYGGQENLVAGAVEALKSCNVAA